MRSGTIAFAAGVCAVQLLSALPDRRGCFLLLPLLLLATLSRWLRLPALFAIGALWAVFRASLVLDQSLPPELEGQHITIAGAVIGLPERVGDATATPVT